MVKQRPASRPLTYGEYPRRLACYRFIFTTPLNIWFLSLLSDHVIQTHVTIPESCAFKRCFFSFHSSLLRGGGFIFGQIRLRFYPSPSAMRGISAQRSFVPCHVLKHQFNMSSTREQTRLVGQLVSIFSQLDVDVC